MLEILHCDKCPGWEGDFSRCLGPKSNSHCKGCACNFPTFFHFEAPGKGCYLSNLVSLGWKKGVNIMCYVLIFIFNSMGSI